jgi:Mg2+/citrate symporter
MLAALGALTILTLMAAILSKRISPVVTLIGIRSAAAIAGTGGFQLTWMKRVVRMR